ncbi:MAG: protein kinase [Deltaproteobacteria bacterium]|nr:protein kinase [Deltaproteobacteria bacterium]
MPNHSTFVSDDSHRAASPADGRARDDVVLPERVGPYRIEGLVGRGGMGEVYRAWDPRLQRTVAIKRILPSRDGTLARARFWREARALAAVHHPGLVTLHDIGEDGGALYLAMELVEGAPASALAGPWPPEEAATVGRAVALALGAAHAVGVIHRDVKPSNVLVGRDGRARVIDFGLARRVDDGEALTTAGTLTGTLSYMAPEQIAGAPLTPATDVFSLGATLYALLVGQSPFSRDSTEATAAAVLVASFEPLATARPGVPAALAAVVEACLARDPKARPADGAALGAALEAVAEELGWALGEDALAARVVASGVVAPAASSGPGRRRRRRWGRAAAVMTGAAVGAAVLAALALTGPGEEAARGPATSATAVSAAAPGAATPAQAALAGLRRMHRRVLAVVPGGAEPGAALVADALATYLGWAPEGVVSVPRRELLARADEDGDLAAEARDAALAAPEHPAHVDAVGVVTTTRAGGVVRARIVWRTPGGDLELGALEAEAPAGAPLEVARALAARSLAFLEVADAPAELPRMTSSAVAYHAWMEAVEALHAEHFRGLTRAVEEALRADPAFAPALALGVMLALASDQPEEAKALLGRLEAVGDAAPPQVRSFATYLAAQAEPAGTLDARRALLTHLERFPRDLTAALELLSMDFRAIGAGKLRRAADEADELLARAPRTPLAASKLARALAWTGDADGARALLAARGLTARTPGMASVFGELALYDRDYASAEALFERSRERDGEMTFYAAHMRMAARMLSGRCWEAVVDGRGMLDAARSTGDRLGIDWTYFLWYNALMCAGRPAEARTAVEEWAARTGTTTAATSYRGYVWYADLALGEVARVREETWAAVEGGRPSVQAAEVLAQIGDDAARLRRAAGALAEELTGQMEDSTASQTAKLERARRGLLARADLLDGRVDEALDAFEQLAGGWRDAILGEGDLFERARWGQALAKAQDDAGRASAAEITWKKVLGLGYERLLAMEVTLAATRRLGSEATTAAGAAGAASDVARTVDDVARPTRE